ncbi:MAG: bacillithiol biosynthesis deacetylase BshB1 [Ignavibacteria bacterium]|jgi:bacillithiol biosynthesis deacetylase BshB1
MKLDALFIGSHPDDIELICGGTVCKLVKSEKKVGILDLTKGELSTRGNLAQRKKETEKATKVLGVEVRKNLGLKDGDIQNNYANRLKLIKIIREYHPEIVFAPYPSDRHPDHINASNFIRESVFYSGLRKIVTGKLSAFRPKNVFYYRHAYDIPISFILDVSEVFDKKIEAIKCYGTQFYNPKIKNEPETYISNKRFLDDIISRAKFFGFKIGVEYGEPFFCYDHLKLDVDSIFSV